MAGERGLPAGQAGPDGGEQLLHPRGVAGHPAGAHRPPAPARGAPVREQVPPWPLRFFLTAGYYRISYFYASNIRIYFFFRVCIRNADQKNLNLTQNYI